MQRTTHTIYYVYITVGCNPYQENLASCYTCNHRAISSWCTLSSFSPTWLHRLSWRSDLKNNVDFTFFVLLSIVGQTLRPQWIISDVSAASSKSSNESKLYAGRSIVVSLLQPSCSFSSFSFSLAWCDSLLSHERQVDPMRSNQNHQYPYLRHYIATLQLRPIW